MPWYVGFLDHRRERLLGVRRGSRKGEVAARAQLLGCVATVCRHASCQSRSRNPLRIGACLGALAVSAPQPLDVEFIIRWATKPSISRTKSIRTSLLNPSSDSCMLSFWVIGFFLMVRLKLCNSTLPKFSDDPPIAPAKLALQGQLGDPLRLGSYTTSWDTHQQVRSPRGSRRASPACPRRERSHAA